MLLIFCGMFAIEMEHLLKHRITKDHCAFFEVGNPYHSRLHEVNDEYYTEMTQRSAHLSEMFQHYTTLCPSLQKQTSVVNPPNSCTLDNEFVHHSEKEWMVQYVSHRDRMK